MKTLSSFLKKERLKSGEFHMAKNEGNTRHMLGKYVVVIRGKLSHFSVWQLEPYFYRGRLFFAGTWRNLDDLNYSDFAWVDMYDKGAKNSYYRSHLRF